MKKSPYCLALEAYLQTKETKNEPLPGYRGKAYYRRVAIEAGISDRQLLPGSKLRLLVDASAHKLGLLDVASNNQHHRSQLFEVHATVTTYEDLKRYGPGWLLKHDYSEKSISSYLSHLNTFQRYLRRDNESSAAGDFSAPFADRLNNYLKATGKGKSVASILRLWAEIYHDLIKSKSLPAGFAPALTELVISSGRTQRDIARAASIKHPTTLLNWMQGDHSPRNPEQVVKLEETLNVLPGTLSCRLPSPVLQGDKRIPKAWWPDLWRAYPATYKYQRSKVIMLIPQQVLSEPLANLKPTFEKALQDVLEAKGEPFYRQKLKGLQKKAYRLKPQKWPEQLKTEFLSLKEYKMAPNSLLNKKRLGRWNDATAQLVQNNLQSFFGFLSQPEVHPDPEMRGMGMHYSDLTLAWLAVQDAVERYLTFRSLRSGGHNGGTETFLGTCIALLQPERGWLWLHPELLHRLPVSQQNIIAASGGWRPYCAGVVLELRDSLNSLNRTDQIRKTRDPMAPILPILDHPEPLSLIDDALNKYRLDLELRGRPNELFDPAVAAQWRDYMLILLLSRFPLRVKHWGLMTYHEDNSGYLQNHVQDGWRLVIPFADFKNVRNKTIFTPHSHSRELTLKFSTIPLLKPLIPWLEFYISTVHPIIAGERHFLFPKKDGTPLTPTLIRDRVTNWTQEYLSQYSSRNLGIPGVFPFGPHAFRDIVATHIIKKTGSMALAANLLLDNEDVVSKHYARFLPEDRVGLAMAGLADSLKKKGAK